MPSDEWLKRNPKITGNIPKALNDKLQSFSKDKNISLSEALRIILESHFNSSEFSTSSQLSDKSSQPVLNSLEKRLESVESQLKEHNATIESLKNSQKSQEENPKVLNSVDNPKPKSSQPVPKRSQLTIFDGWLTTGEAFTQLKERGYEKSQGTLRRTLAKGQVPQELEKLGLTADFEVRQQTNPKDNSVRWLKIENK